MNLTSKEAILGQSDKKIQALEVPEWGAMTVYIRVMNGRDRDEFEGFFARQRAAAKKKGQEFFPDNFRSVVAAFTLCDTEGKRIFSLDDVDALGEKSSDALDRIAEAACKLNKLTDQEVSELRKNS
jgi:hypothetical protein